MNSYDEFTKHSALSKFRLQTLPAVTATVLADLYKEYLTLEGLRADVALVTFEEKCLESFKMFCRDLRAAGYKEITVNVGAESSIIRAQPRLEGNPIWQAPLWTIAIRYFPITANKGGDIDSQFQVIALQFPSELAGWRSLEEEQ